MVDAGLEALTVILTPERLGFLSLGILMGMMTGLLPGLSGVTGMAVLLPFTYGLDPFTGVAMLIGVIAVNHTSDLFPSIVIGVPGSSGSQATIMDGYPLAKQGEAGRAIGAALTSSVVGGIIGAVVMVATLSIARPLVLSLGSPQLFMLTLLGLSTVGILAKGSPLMGLAGALFGMLLGAVGMAPAVAVDRYTFDWLYLTGGLSIGTLALGLFAIPELVDLLAERHTVSKSGKLGGGLFAGVLDSWRHRWVVVGSSAAGAVIGLIPGLGGSIVDWLVYGGAKQALKDTSGFGKGDIRGVIAPEASNNAKEGGTLIPTLLFGIPAGGMSALLLGGLLLMGVETGPSMLTKHLDVTLSIAWTLVIANILAAVACFAVSRFFIRVSIIPPSAIVPFIFLATILAAYQTTQTWGDITMLLAIGVLGWFMKRLGWARPPLLIGFILAGSAERYLHISISRYGTAWFADPVVIVVGILIVAVVLVGTISRRDVSGKMREAAVK